MVMFKKHPRASTKIAKRERNVGKVERWIPGARARANKGSAEIGKDSRKGVVRNGFWQVLNQKGHRHCWFRVTRLWLCALKRKLTASHQMKCHQLLPPSFFWAQGKKEKVNSNAQTTVVKTAPTDRFSRNPIAWPG